MVAREDGAAQPAQLYGYTAEQLKAWWPKFNERLKVHLDKSRSLMELNMLQNRLHAWMRQVLICNRDQLDTCSVCLAGRLLRLFRTVFQY